MTDITGTNKERYDKTIRRREKLSGYYFDMSKLVFAATVLTNFNFVTNEIGMNNIMFGVCGLVSTVALAMLGNNILKF